MGGRWIDAHRRDPYRRKARREGYRARSAYKLQQIQERFGILRNGDTVLDIGCFPGGWTQVAIEHVGSEGSVIGVDLRVCPPLTGATMVVGDIMDPNLNEEIMALLENAKFNAVISDIAPGITGAYGYDVFLSMQLTAASADFALRHLTDGGSFVSKVFTGAGIEKLIGSLRKYFSIVQRFDPMASRNSSSETYIIARNLKPNIPRPKILETPTQDAVSSAKEDDDETKIKPATGFRVVRKQKKQVPDE